jgi:hypothetical protein
VKLFQANHYSGEYRNFFLPHVIPAKAGIHRQCEAWIPAFAGMA